MMISGLFVHHPLSAPSFAGTNQPEIHLRHDPRAPSPRRHGPLGVTGCVAAAELE